MSVSKLIDVAKESVGKDAQGAADFFRVSKPIGNWCAWFVRMCGKEAGISFGSSDEAKNVTAPYGVFKFVAGAAGTTKNKPRAGDVLFIQPQNQNGISHVGICEEIVGGTIYSIEGNMSGSATQNSTVKRASYSLDTGDGDTWGTIINFGATTAI